MKKIETHEIGKIIRNFIQEEIAGTLLTEEDIIISIEKRENKIIMVMHKDQGMVPKKFKEWLIK